MCVLVLAAYNLGASRHAGPGLSILRTATAATVGATGATRDDSSRRDSYFPNTEPLGQDEMRVVALGTGTPNFRRSQASAAWLVELGNGEKFIFDIGTGSLANLGALEIPYTYLDKIFVRRVGQVGHPASFEPTPNMSGGRPPSKSEDEDQHENRSDGI